MGSHERHAPNSAKSFAQGVSEADAILSETGLKNGGKGVVFEWDSTGIYG